MTKYVYDFSEGDRDQTDLLGGKGANLAEMTRLGLPVPPGFTITTEACREFLAEGDEPEGLQSEINDAITRLEETIGRKIGGESDPLLVSVRSGAKFSMPGMMDTVLNVGLNDISVDGLTTISGNARFAWDSYRRLIQMFGKTVMDIDSDLFSDALDSAVEAAGVETDVDLDVASLRDLVDTFKKIFSEQTGTDFPQDPRQQIDLAVRAVFLSWNTPRASLYRRRERISDDLGTAVNICTMVFGNLDDRSGTGVGFTRDPATGALGVYGDYLEKAQGEDVVSGIRNTLSFDEFRDLDETSHGQLVDIMHTLEAHYRDLCDIEFTVERGKLWMLQTRVGKRTASAAFCIASQLIDEGLITIDEALSRVTGAQLGQLMFPQFDSSGPRSTFATGMAASPGAAVGRAVFDSATAVEWADRGEKVVLLRKETNPDDLAGMVASEGILTARGGKTSHAAVVARGMGKTCVCGAAGMHVKIDSRTATCNSVTISEGDVISINGSTGEVFIGELPVVPSPVSRYLEEGLEAALAQADNESCELIVAVDRILGRADAARRLGVRANADTAADAMRARALGAEGIGLCRTEHMFLGDRRVLVERVILADTDQDQEEALLALLAPQRDDFIEILEAMDGLPSTIRLLDPPLHEFLPNHADLRVKVALAEERGEVNEADVRLLSAVERLHESNPMLGLRGVRLGLLVPGLFRLQVRAIAEASVERIRAGGHPQAEIMVPLVGSVTELHLIRDDAEAIISAVSVESGIPLDIPVGTMIELPRAALTAGRIAEAADFFSFGTNDLTQTTWGFSRDDVEAAFFSTYLEKGVFKVSPFETIDFEGVGELVRIACERGRAQRPDLHLGVCGEHGGDPDSIHFFDEVGLDYVSCSPFRVPVARLEAGRSAISAE